MRARSESSSRNVQGLAQKGTESNVSNVGNMIILQMNAQI